jgi:pimeloyl-ACP methyl ester carboxylesterase
LASAAATIARRQSHWQGWHRLSAACGRVPVGPYARAPRRSDLFPRIVRIYLDLPGRGRTPGAAWITTNDQVLDIVLQVLDRVIPGQRFVIAGQSAGGYLARAVLHRRMAVVDGLLQVVPEFPADDEELPEVAPLVSDLDPVERAWVELGAEQASAFATRLVVQTPEIYERFKTLLPGFIGHDAEFLGRLRHTLSFDVDRLPAVFPAPALFCSWQAGHNRGLPRGPRSCRAVSARDGVGPGSRGPCPPLGTGSRVSKSPLRLAHAHRGERHDHIRPAGLIRSASCVTSPGGYSSGGSIW